MSSIDREQIDAIRQALFCGRKIEAIKVYREATGKGLKESKEFIDALSARLRDEEPEKFSAPSGGGCMGAAAILATIFCVATAYTLAI